MKKETALPDVVVRARDRDKGPVKLYRAACYPTDWTVAYEKGELS